MIKSSRKAHSQARPGRGSQPHPKSLGLIAEMKQAKTVDAAISQPPLKTRQALQSGNPELQIHRTGGMLAAPSGQFSARPGKNILSLSAKVPGLPHVPYPQSSWCPWKGPRALSTTVTWVGLEKQPPPAWQLQYIPSLPHSQQQPLSLLLQGTTPQV